MKGVYSMPKKKYSDELKLEIVEKYLKENISTKQLAKKYYIGSEADIKKWIAMYEHLTLLDKNLIKERGRYIGDLEPEAMEQVKNCLKVQLAL